MLCFWTHPSFGLFWLWRKYWTNSHNLFPYLLGQSPNYINVIVAVKCNWHTDTTHDPLYSHRHRCTNTLARCHSVICVLCRGTQPSVNREWQREWKHAWTLLTLRLLLLQTVFQFLLCSHKLNPLISQVRFYKRVNPPHCGKQSLICSKTELWDEVGQCIWLVLVWYIVICRMSVCLQLSTMCSQSLSLGVRPTFQNTRNSQRGAISTSNVSQAKRE